MSKKHDAPAVSEAELAVSGVASRVGGNRRMAQLQRQQLFAGTVSGPVDEAAPQAPVQMRVGAEGPMGDVHQAARVGTSGSSHALPHQSAIQQAFGKHDVSGIEAHTDAHASQGARAMGADAFAQGNHVSFDGSPSLHLAAHEATHVIQQRAGVHLKSSVGAEGDEYEVHADAVADAVVQGKSAEALLSRYAGAPGSATAPAPAVQMNKNKRRLARQKQREFEPAQEQQRAETARKRQLRSAFKTQLRASTNLDSDYAALQVEHAGDVDALGILDEVYQLVKDQRDAGHVQDAPLMQSVKAFGDQMAMTLKTKASLAEFKTYCEGVAKLCGMAPLQTILEWVLDNPGELAAWAADGAAVTAAVDAVRAAWKQQAGEQATREGSNVPAQRVDPNNRVRPEDKEQYGPAARHGEALKLKGDRNRQVVLGIGRPGQPEGYQDFAKDYGVWDYESWVDWNKNNANFSDIYKDSDVANNTGAGVDKVLKGKDDQGREIFERLHFRLTGVFPTIAGMRDKLVAGLGLYQYKLMEGAEYQGQPTNDLWTLGEFMTIMTDPELKAKTVFYGKQKGEFAEAAQMIADDQLAPVVMAEADRLKQIGDSIALHYRGVHAADKPLQVRKFRYIGEKFWMIPEGRDAVIANVDANVV